MKMLKLVIVLLSLLLITTGCLAEIRGQRITVQKWVADRDIYEDFNVINQRKLVRKAKEIVNNADWENGKVEMMGNADYQFQFPSKNNGEDKIMSYDLWLPLKEDGVEITSDGGKGKYVKLTEENSAILYEILTGEKLSERPNEAAKIVD